MEKLVERKRSLEERMFAPRVLISEKKYRTPGIRTVTPKDVARFLDLAAAGGGDKNKAPTLGGHRMFYKYIKPVFLSGLLKSKVLMLTRLDLMNDLDEFAYTVDACRIYVASLQFGSQENAAMWKMYGDGDSIRLAFPGDLVRQHLVKQTTVFTVDEKDGTPGVKKDKPLLDNEIETWSFHDVAYSYGEALVWNMKVMGPSRCPEIKNVLQIPELQTYIKRYGWVGENESRLVVKLKDPHPELKRIAVNFDAALEKMNVTIVPESSKIAKVYRAFAANGMSVHGRSILRSSYEIDFGG